MYGNIFSGIQIKYKTPNIALFDSKSSLVTKKWKTLQKYICGINFGHQCSLFYKKRSKTQCTCDKKTQTIFYDFYVDTRTKNYEDFYVV